MADTKREDVEQIASWLENVTEDEACANPWTWAESCACGGLTLRALLTERDAAQAEVARLTAALAEAETRGWQPISTAPKDGTPICLYAPSRKEPFQCGFWIWEADENDDPSDGIWWLGDGREDDQPTHWKPIMPLPLPPRDRDGQEG